MNCAFHWIKVSFTEFNKYAFNLTMRNSLMASEFNECLTFGVWVTEVIYFVADHKSIDIIAIIKLILKMGEKKEEQFNHLD